MKRYDFKSDQDYACACHRVESEDGFYVIYSDAQAIVEDWQWLSEVQALKIIRVRSAGAWAPKLIPGNSNTAKERKALKDAWRRRTDSNHELQTTLKVALAAAEETS